EAHHMYVGESGVARVIQRTCEVMAQHKTDDPTRVRALGVVDLLPITPVTLLRRLTRQRSPGDSSPAASGF
ncbi:MAG: hypothetical protein ACLQA5_10175, partial [Solirubrobacteraceae bacterium]